MKDLCRGNITSGDCFMASLKILIEMRNLQVIYEREIIIVSFVSNDILDHINKVGKKLNMMCKRSPQVRPPDFELADLDRLSERRR